MSKTLRQTSEINTAVDANSLHLHAYPIFNFLVLSVTSSVVILVNKKSYFVGFFLLSAFTLLFLLQTRFLNTKNSQRDSTKCINATAIYWLTWLVFGVIYAEENVFKFSSFRSKTSPAAYYFFSTLQCLLGIHAHLRHTAISDIESESELNLNLYIFEKETFVTKKNLDEFLNYLFFALFISFPTSASHFPCMHPIEAFIRPLLMFILACATVAIKSCNNQTLYWPAVLREISWITMCNPFCLLVLFYQIASLSLKASNFFSFLGKKISIDVNHYQDESTSGVGELHSAQETPAYETPSQMVHQHNQFQQIKQQHQRQKDLSKQNLFFQQQHQHQKQMFQKTATFANLAHVNNVKLSTPTQASNAKTIGSESGGPDGLNNAVNLSNQTLSFKFKHNNRRSRKNIR